MTAMQSPSSQEYQGTSLFQLFAFHNVFPCHVGKPAWQVGKGDVIYGNQSDVISIGFQTQCNQFLPV